MRVKATVLLFITVFLLISPAALGEQSGGSAQVVNAAPPVSGASVALPRTDDYFNISFTVSDENTLEDLDYILVVVWDKATSTYGASDNASNHYTFRWNETGWHEESLSGHLVLGTEPGDLTAASGAWSLYATFADASVVGNYTVRAVAYDGGGASDSDEAHVVRDRLEVSAFTRDVANEVLYARLVYKHDGAAISGGTLGFAGLQAETNSTGWAEFDLSQAPGFTWGTECYGVTDALYGIADTGVNQTVTLAKAGRVIGGDAAVDAATWDGTYLDIEFNLTTGVYETEVSGPKPVYLLNATYDLDSDYTDRLTVGHDGTRSIRVAYPSWGGLRVRGLTHGRLTSVSLVGEELAMVVDGDAGSGTLYVDCTGRGAPQRTSGFDETWYQPGTSLFWGIYTLSSNVTLEVDFAARVGGGGTTVVDIMLDTLTVEAVQGEETEVELRIKWTGPLYLTVQSVAFGDYVDWFAVREEMPLRLAGEGPLKTGKMPLALTPPPTAQPGNYTVPVEVMVGVTGYASIYARSYIYLTVTEAHTAQPPPAQGPIPTAVGYALGLGLIAAIALALWRRA